jgi:hypothetical protein
MRYADQMRRYQNLEGLSLIDGKTSSRSSSTAPCPACGRAHAARASRQSGATGIPLVRLFGQSPAGLNSDGESHLRTYYEGINQAQMSTTRASTPCTRWPRGRKGIKLPDDFSDQVPVSLCQL